MARWILRNATFFDGFNADLVEGKDLIIEDGFVRDIETHVAPMDGFEEIDLKGKFVLPGLIDCHVHVYASDVNLTKNMRAPYTFLAQYAGKFLRTALGNGFTTIRDVGGADYGLARALKQGLLPGPRLYYGGRLLSQTGGHADWRPPDEDDMSAHLCNCGGHDQKLAVIADGKEGVIRAVREELRRGASHIKILASGGVASPSDPVDDLQFSDEETIAIVEECERRDVYVAAHCHPAASIERSVRLGVRSIEHGTMIDDDTAEYVAKNKAYIVPTFAVIHALFVEGEKLGLPPASVAKIKEVRGFMEAGLESMKRAGCKLGFGTDLLGQQHEMQPIEFALRKDVFSPLEILRQATSMNAEILMEDRLGCIRPGAFADLIAVHDNPLDDIEVLSKGGASLAMIMKDGQMHKLQLAH